MNMNYVEPIGVARYFLARARLAGEEVTHMKLQKLMYYAYGHTLACTNSELFEEEIEAWQFGPVVRSVYDQYADFGRSPIIDSQDSLEETFPPEIAIILDAVCNRYMPESPYTLMDITHRELPWSRTYQDGKKLPIPIEYMKEQFSVGPVRLEPLSDADMAEPAELPEVAEKTIAGPTLMEELLGTHFRV